MSIGVKKRMGESFNSLLYRFNKKLKRSGIFKEIKKKRFHKRPVSKNKRRSSALYRVGKAKEMKQLRRYSHGPHSRGR